MPMVDLIDETFVVADPAEVAVALHAEALWQRLFPDLELTVFQDRGPDGIRFTVTGALVGSSEFWVEPWGDGAIVHYYLRADLTAPHSDAVPLTAGPRALARRAVRARTRHVRRLKAGLNAVKDDLERGRLPGLGRTE